MLQVRKLSRTTVIVVIIDTNNTYHNNNYTIILIDLESKKYIKSVAINLGTN